MILHGVAWFCLIVPGMYPPNPGVFFIPCQAAVRVRWNILAKHYEGLALGLGGGQCRAGT